MTPRAFDPLRALRLLIAFNVRFVVIGGFASRIWGSPTVTNDLDLCYERTAKNHENLAACLNRLHATLRGVDESLPFILDARTFALGDSFTFLTDAGNLDCLGTPPGTSGYGDLMKSAHEFDLGDALTVHFASVDDLIRMKRASGRPKDLIEVEILLAVREEIG